MTRPARRRLLLALVVATVISVAGCSDDPAGMDQGSREGAAMWAAKMDFVGQHHAPVGTLRNVATDASFCDLDEDSVRWALALRDGPEADVEHLQTVGAFIHTYCPNRMGRFQDITDEVSPELVPLLEMAVMGWDEIQAGRDPESVEAGR